VKLEECDGFIFGPLSIVVSWPRVKDGFEKVQVGLLKSLIGVNDGSEAAGKSEVCVERYEAG